MSRDLQSLLQRTAPKNLDKIRFPHGTNLDEAFWRNFLGGVEPPGFDILIQPGEVDGAILDTKGILKSTLWHTTLQWHLATFEPTRDTGPGAALLAFITLGGAMPTVTGTNTATNSLAALRRALSGLQITKVHDFIRYYARASLGTGLA